jgi:hypothetical protein
MMKESIRNKASEHNDHFLSSLEWNAIDEKLAKISSATFRKAYRGLRENAFKVAKLLFSSKEEGGGLGGIDPVVENEENQDLFGVVKEQYNYLVQVKIREIQEFRVKMSKIVLPPTDIEATRRRNLRRQSVGKAEESVLQDLSGFCDSLKDNLLARLENINRDELL